MLTPVARAARLALGLCALAFAAVSLAGVSPASAQYYPPGYYGGPPPGYYNPEPRPYYRPEPRGYYNDGYSRPRRVPMGNVCVTSRGECMWGRPVPLGSLCKCHIPGFGPKRGTIQ